MSVAISRDRDSYAWGRDRPAEEQDVRLAMLPEQGEDVRLIEVGGGKDVVDVGVGSSHIALTDSEGVLWVIGGNDNGQLGLEDVKGHLESWREVQPLVKPVTKVWCGDNNTFILL